MDHAPERFTGLGDHGGRRWLLREQFGGVTQQAVATWEAVVQFDPEILHVEDAFPGDDIFDSSPTLTFDNVIGVATLSGDASGVVDTEGFFKAAELHFNVVGSVGETSAITFTHVEMRDDVGAVIPNVTSVDTSTTVEEAPPVPTLTWWALVFLALTMFGALTFRHKRNARQPS